MCERGNRVVTALDSLSPSESGQTTRRWAPCLVIVLILFFIWFVSYTKVKTRKSTYLPIINNKNDMKTVHHKNVKYLTY